MGVKCKYYKLCSVESKLVYFSQFWGMKHFLGSVCDLQPKRPLHMLAHVSFEVNTYGTT